jgi:hypothetical protein
MLELPFAVIYLESTIDSTVDAMIQGKNTSPVVHVPRVQITRISQLDVRMLRLIPADALKAIPESQQIWQCAYCGFVWHQPSSARPGVDASGLGFIDDSRNFIENRNVPIRD